MNNTFGVQYDVSIEEEARERVDLELRKREICDKQMDDYLTKVWFAITKPHQVIVKEWQEEQLPFYKRYWKMGYIALSRPKDVESPDELLWHDSDLPMGSVLEIEGRLFKRVGKSDPIWRLVDESYIYLTFA